MKSKDLEGPFLVEELPATCYIYIYIYIYIYVCIYMYVYGERNVCIYMYKHIYTYKQDVCECHSWVLMELCFCICIIHSF